MTTLGLLQQLGAVTLRAQSETDPALRCMGAPQVFYAVLLVAGPHVASPCREVGGAESLSLLSRRSEGEDRSCIVHFASVSNRGMEWEAHFATLHARPSTRR